MNIRVGIMNQCDTQRLTSSRICMLRTYILWSSDFASYLEDYLMANTVFRVMDHCDTKIYVSQ